MRGIEEVLCFHPDPMVLFRPSVKKSARKGILDLETKIWEKNIKKSLKLITVLKRPTATALICRFFLWLKSSTSSVYLNNNRTKEQIKKVTLLLYAVRNLLKI